MLKVRMKCYLRKERQQFKSRDKCIRWKFERDTKQQGVKRQGEGNWQVKQIQKA